MLSPVIDDEHLELSAKIQEARDEHDMKRAKAGGDPDKRISTMHGRIEKMDVVSGLMWNGPSAPVQSILGAIPTSFFERCPALLKGLDEVAKLHPFAAVAVIAFKAVYELETKRRENDKKVMVLYDEMGDMMGALLQLRTIKSEQEVGPDGFSVRSRMENLVQWTATDIKECANVCETYLKKKTLSRLVASSKWEHTLAKFAGHFLKRRSEIEFALSVHTGVRIEEVNKKLDRMELLQAQVNKKMEAMMHKFESIMSTEQREINTWISRKGGVQTVLGNEKMLRELLEFSRSFPGHQASGARGGRSRSDGVVDFDELKAEVREDPEDAARENMATFARKFEMQQRQVVDQISRMVHREGDRVIDAVTAGPHDRLVDPDLHTIWKDMGWRGSVKARHFVLALRDYFRDKVDEGLRTGQGTDSSVQERDGWALEWINVTRLQPIAEAFDDDASGFITINEANEFTISRPAGWSLLHWLAYWAIGWQFAATVYRDKIERIFNDMFALKPKIHPAVRSSVDYYLHVVWTEISELTSSLQPYYPTPALRDKFQGYIDSEERRLREGLKVVRYDIDALNTVALITGRGRIEKYAFPLLYLLLERDLQVMHIAQHKVINKDELWDAADTIHWVLQAVDYRYGDLQDIFRQQKLDPRQQFKSFACGMFEHWRNPAGNWTRSWHQVSQGGRDGPGDDHEDVPQDILNYQLESDDLFDPSGYDAPGYIATEKDLKAKWPLKAILGPWCGFVSKGYVYPSMPMFSIHVHAVDSFHFEASGHAATGTSYTVEGTYLSDESSRICYTFSITYATRHEPMHFRGFLYDRGATFSGTWSTQPLDPSLNGTSFDRSLQSKPSTPHSNSPDTHVAQGRFVFKRIPHHIMCCRPDPLEFQLNKTRALWKFALSAVRVQVGMRLCLWSYLSRRRDIRKRYIELLIRLNYGTLNEGEKVELARIRQMLTPADARLYETRYDYELRTVPIHMDSVCDHCESVIIGPRIICLDCDSTKSVDLCDDSRCRYSEIDTEKRPDLPSPHHPSHAVYKVRAVLHIREFEAMRSSANAALKSARDAFNDAAELLPDPGSNGAARERGTHFSASVKERLSCIVCKAQVLKPCWYCIVCEDPTFICLGCDAKGPLTIKRHDKLHPLVLCQDPVPLGPITIEQRLDHLEQRFTDMEGRFGHMEQRFDAMESRFGAVEDRMADMDDKLSRVEKMLSSMWDRSKKLASSRRTQSIDLLSGAPALSRSSDIRPLPMPAVQLKD